MVAGFCQNLLLKVLVCKFVRTNLHTNTFQRWWAVSSSPCRNPVHYAYGLACSAGWRRRGNT